MSVITPAQPKTQPPQTPRSAGLFRAFWRWHFYASAIVIPVMLMLSVTGLVMLFKWQLDPLQHPGVLTVDPPAQGTPLAPSDQEAAAIKAYPEATITAAQLGAENRSSYFTMAMPDGVTRNVYVDPWRGEVLGAIDPKTQWSGIANDIHGNLIFGHVTDTVLFQDPITGGDFVAGSFGDRFIELASCWAIVMTLTGYYLFVKGRRARWKRRVKEVPGAKTRHRHGVVGAVVGVGILLLVVTGLPWTGLWGAKVQQFATGQGFSLWGQDPGATSDLGAKLDAAGSDTGPAPWAEGSAPLPDTTGAHAGHDMGSMAPASGGRISLDQAVGAAAADGVPAPYFVAYPGAEDGVFSVMSDMWHDKASAAYDNVSLERVVHVDQYSGEIAGRYSYADYPAMAKLVTQGIAIHEGQRLGSLNFWGSAAFCVAVIFLCISGPLMWWRRRPQGQLGAPVGRMPIRSTPWLIAALVVLGLALPLFGVSLLLILAIDAVVSRRRPQHDELSVS